MDSIAHHVSDDLLTHTVVVAAAAFVQDARGRVLVQSRPDDDRWTLPYGPQLPGKSLGETIVRTLAADVGLPVEIVGLVGIYNEPSRRGDRSRGDPRRRVSVCLRARPLSRVLAVNSHLRWATREELEALPMDDPTRLRVGHGLDNLPGPHVEARLRKRRAQRHLRWPKRW